jgi:hypothetical protein
MIYTHVAKGPAPQCESPLDILPTPIQKKESTASSHSIVIPLPVAINSPLLTLVEDEMQPANSHCEDEKPAHIRDPEKLPQEKFIAPVRFFRWPQLLANWYKRSVRIFG